MIVNPKIKEFLELISKETINFENSKFIDIPKRNMLKRFVKFYKEHLSEDEQVFVMYYLLHNLNYKNLLIDPETILTIHNIKLRTIFFIVVGVIISLIFAAILFRTNDSLNRIIDILGHILDVVKL